MTPEQVTPELARELLAKAYPEPRFVDEWTAEEVQYPRPVTVAETFVPLVEAAPALAELVANMRTEYTVQVKAPPFSRFMSPTWDSLRIRGSASVFPTREQAESFAERVSTETRIVRRLATDWEVAE